MKYACLVVFVMISTPALFSMGITATGDWDVNIDETNLTGGPGSDIEATYDSANNQTTINIFRLGQQSTSWRVDINKVDQTWHSGFTVYAQRTSGGVTGGTTYQEITDTAREFFHGTGNVSNIQIQYRLSGVSLQVPAATYSIEVYYTLVYQ
jgi:hypothetical protein